VPNQNGFPQSCCVAASSRFTGERQNGHRAMKENTEPFVAVFDGADREILSAIESVLARENIICTIEGSTVYSVAVPRKDAKRAVDSLHDSEKLKDKWHKLFG